jgi:putative ABC transport system permease protein
VTPVTTVELGPRLAIALVALTIGAALVVQLGGLGDGRSTLIAAVRATVQLAAVSAVILFVLRSLWWTFAFLLLMIVVAAGTAAHRIAGSVRGPGWWAAVPIVTGVFPVVALILISGAVPLHPVAVLPMAGILIGNSMVATSLSGRRLGEELLSRRGEYEAALSIGLTRRQSVHLVGRPAASIALVPGMDQTRTVGLVTLPGAFIGVLLAGASAWQAGATQLLVLIGLLLVQSLAVLVTVELVAAGLLPAGLEVLPL